MDGKFLGGREDDFSFRFRSGYVVRDRLGFGSLYGFLGFLVLGMGLVLGEEK